MVFDAGRKSESRKISSEDPNLMLLLSPFNQKETRSMAKRLGAKHKKSRKDKATAYKTGQAPKPHKVAVERSKKAKKKMFNRA